MSASHAVSLAGLHTLPQQSERARARVRANRRPIPGGANGKERARARSHSRVPARTGSIIRAVERRRELRHSPRTARCGRARQKAERYARSSKHIKPFQVVVCVCVKLLQVKVRIHISLVEQIVSCGGPFPTLKKKKASPFTSVLVITLCVCVCVFVTLNRAGGKLGCARVLYVPSPPCWHMMAITPPTRGVAAPNITVFPLVCVRACVCVCVCANRCVIHHVLVMIIVADDRPPSSWISMVGISSRRQHSSVWCARLCQLEGLSSVLVGPLAVDPFQFKGCKFDVHTLPTVAALTPSTDNKLMFRVAVALLSSCCCCLGPPVPV